MQPSGQQPVQPAGQQPAAAGQQHEGQPPEGQPPEGQPPEGQQPAADSGEIVVPGVASEKNIADVLTKYVTAEDLARHMREMGFHMVEPGSAALGELSHCWTEVGEVPMMAAQTFDASFNSFLVCEPISSPPICGHVLSTGAKGGCLCGDHYWVRGWG